MEISSGIPENDFHQYISQSWNLRQSNSKEILKLALKLRLVSYDETNNSIALTDRGSEFLRSSSKENVSLLTESQKSIIIEIFFHENLVKEISNDIVKHDDSFCILRQNKKIYTTNLLKDVDLIKDRGDVYFLHLSENYETEWKKYIKKGFFSEEDLFQILEKQKKLGKQGEVIAFNFEQEIVKMYQNPDLFNQVKLISKEHVDYGYDIESVSEDSSPKYIEVKTTSQKNLRFFVSRNEYEISKNLGEKYWIYFVDLFNNQILRFNDIQNKVESGLLLMKPSHFEVTFDTIKLNPLINNLSVSDER